MYAGEFDGAAAFSGGGFMPSQATQTTDPSFSPAKPRESQVLLPLTVKQINEAILSTNDKSNFLIDGVDANNVTLVGMVFNKADRVTDITFVLDDGTGRIDCTRWVVQEAVEVKEMEGIVDGMYVRVHGHLKGFQGKRTLNTFFIRAVTDFNEIANHFIECIYVHLYNCRLQKAQAGNISQPHMTNSVMGTPSKGYQAAPSNQYSGHAKVDVQDHIGEMVLNFLQKSSIKDSEKGAHRDVIAQQLNIPLPKLMEAIKYLEEEGFVYSTTDEFHFKSAGNM